MVAKVSVILIVDDALENIEILKEILKNEYKVIFTTHGADALTLAVKEKPDLILLDVMMPRINGYEVCQQLNIGYSGDVCYWACRYGGGG
jgi:CheY-like chemotaxis protein